MCPSIIIFYKDFEEWLMSLNLSLITKRNNYSLRSVVIAKMLVKTEFAYNVNKFIVRDILNHIW